MHKRVLLIESANTVRGVVETILRQNGYEVISVGDCRGADEVLHLSHPDLIIVGADELTADGTPYIETLQADSKLASLPLLLLSPPGSPAPSPPQENVIPQPIDPRELTRKVTESMNRTGKAASSDSLNPLGESEVDDDFLDAALGLDRIDVTDSEVMDKTSVVRKGQGRGTAEKLVGYDDYTEDDADLSETSRVESLIVDEDSTEIKSKTPQKQPPPPPSATSKLELVEDQYGLVNPENAETGNDEDLAHDYDWFVSSMHDEAERPPAQKEITSAEDVISSTDPAETPASGKVSGSSKNVSKRASGESKGGGVDEFIDEFKKEMELLRSTESDSVVVKEEVAPVDRPSSGMSWDEQLEKLTAEEAGLFTSKFASELAGKLAREIASKIDSDKLLNLIKEEIIKRARQGG